ncbi:PilX N-terminal domain-containing pilus assembly protein [Planctomycetota bacterium]
MINSCTDPRSPIPNSQTGIVLLVVLGVLALLSVLAITFVSMTRLERSISRNYVDRTRAILAAESGVEYAIKRIANFHGGVLLQAEAAAMQYQEGDYSVPLEQADKPSFQIPGKPFSGIISSASAQASDYYKLKAVDLSARINLNDGNLAYNLPDPPYDIGGLQSGDRRLTMMISYLCELVFAESMGVVGIGDTIAMAIETAKDELPGGRFTSMAEVKTVLAENVDLNQNDWLKFQQYFTIHSWQDPTVLRPTFQVDISVPDTAAPAPLYADGGADLYLYLDMQTKKFDLDTRSPININTAAKKTIQMLFALVSGWYLKEGPGCTLGNCHYGKWKITSSKGNFHGKAFEYYYDDENINLMAMPFRQKVRKQNIFGQICRSVALDDFSGEGNYASDIADMLWQRIHEENNPIETWDEFQDVLSAIIEEVIPDDDPYWVKFWTNWYIGAECYGSSFGGFFYPYKEESLAFSSAYGRQIVLDCLLANFNPNSQLNDYNPNLSVNRHVDKSQLATYTTELCFEPTGFFEIQSLGEILNPGGIILARSEINTMVKVFEYFRQSTQAQFMAGYDEEPDLDDYFSKSTSVTTALAGLSTDEGYSLQSYPEPVTPDNHIADSHFDGQLMLATWQPDLNEYELDVGNYTVPVEIDRLNAPYNPQPILRCTFRTDIKPEDFGNNIYTMNDAAEPGTGYIGYPADFYQPKNSAQFRHLFNLPKNDRLTYDMAASEPVPGALFPDGALSDACRSIGIPAGNFGKERGNITAMQFWIKPNFNTSISTRVRQILCFARSARYGSQLSGPPQLSMYFFTQNLHNDETKMYYYPCFSSGRWAPTRTLIIGWGFRDHGVGLFSPTVNHNFVGHSNAQHGIFPEYNFEGHQWNHMGISWNTYGSGEPDASWFLVTTVNGEIVDPRRWGQEGSNFVPMPDMWMERDFKNCNVVRFGENVLGYGRYPYLDAGNFDDGVQNYVADSTYDDIIGFMDFVPGELFTQFYRWGRYYNENDAAYTSPPINLHRQLKLDRREILRPRSVSWTVYWPKYNRDGDQVVDNILPPVVNPDDPDDPLAAKWGASLDPISIDIGLMKQGYTSVEWMFGDLADQKPTYAGGSKFSRIMPDGYICTIASGDEFHYRVHFNLETSPDNQTLYDTPVFDDISFTFHIKPKVLRWQVIN